MSGRRPARALGAGLALLLTAACGSTVNTPLEEAVVGGPGASSTSVAAGGALAPTTGTGGATPGAPASRGAPTSGPAGGEATATTAPAAAAGAGGPGAPTGPIQLGFLTTKVSNAGAFGFTTGSNLNEKDVINALLGQMNAQGGIHGRKALAVFSDTDTASVSWDADFAAGCAAFTEDHHVEAVLGYVFGQADALEQCLTRKKIPHLSATFGTPDLVESRQAPYLFNLASPTIERRSILKVDGAIAAGLLTKSSHLGVVMDACPSTARSWSTIVKPYIERKGIPIATVFALGCPRGAGDAAGEVGRIGSLVLALRSANVDTVLLQSASEGPALFVAANAMEPQGYRPTFLVSSLAQTAVTGDQMPPAQRANVHGWGWMPLNDAKRPQWPALPPAASRCLGMLKKGGIVPNTSTDYASALFTCDAVFLFQEAVDITGGRTDGPSIAAAIESMGSRHQSALSLDGSSTFGPGHHDGPTTTRPFDYDGGCSCFRYKATTRPIP
jgi:ABC-type branched-subunit amino acid transport system substrate-binding protein